MYNYDSGGMDPNWEFRPRTPAKVSMWQPISTAKEVHDPVILVRWRNGITGEWNYSVARYQPRYKGWTTSPGFHFINPVEWMPIPGDDE